jgi:tetratricopeptide (TPR) repeat protein
MAKSPRMEKIEAMLAEDPDDSFLRYSLGMEHASGGDDEAAVAAFRALIALKPEDRDTVPAYHMCGQALARLGREPEAVAVLRAGIAVARRVGDSHAAGEMDGLLATIE